jgi:DNA uptake protein ComE-like DNA-binding protein
MLGWSLARPGERLSGRTVAGLFLVVILGLLPLPARAQGVGGEEALLKMLGLGALAGRAAATVSLPRLDLNRATMRQLAQIPGVDYVLARRIIIERPYAAVEELRRIGLTAAAVQKIAPFVTVVAASTAPR